MNTLPVRLDATMTFITGRVYAVSREHTIECRIVDIDLDNDIAYVAFRDKVRMIAGVVRIGMFDDDDIPASDILDAYDRGHYEHLPFSRQAQLFD